MNDTRLESFRRVLAAALGTPYYRPLLEAASLGSLEYIRRLTSVPEGLERLPPLEAPAYLSRPAWFKSASAGRSAPPVWRSPQAPSARTAVLMEGFCCRGNARLFPNGLGRRLAWYRPEVVAGPLTKIRKLGRALESGELRIGPLSRAVFVILRPHEQPLNDEDREQLWRQFQVPIYEHLVGYAEELLAWECEAREGLHLCSETAIFEILPAQQCNWLLVTSLANLAYPMLRFIMAREGTIVGGLCPCGQSGERLITATAPMARRRDSRRAAADWERAAAVLS